MALSRLTTDPLARSCYRSPLPGRAVIRRWVLQEYSQEQKTYSHPKREAHMDPTVNECGNDVP